jgi:hypothetical protein
MQDLLEPNFLPPLPNIAQDGRRNQFSHLLLHFFFRKRKFTPTSAAAHNKIFT